MQLNQYIDHTLLKPEATEAAIEQVIKEATENSFYSIMVNPYWVKKVKAMVEVTDVKTACVIGFPLGANKTSVKVFEAEEAIADGADEVDMVMNIGEFKSGHYDLVQKDMEAVVAAAHAKNVLVKVIIETALLTDEEIKKASELVMAAKAEFVKTSTGFSTRGAAVNDVKIMKAAVGDTIAVKAAGGIHSAEDAEEMINAGATRLGVSSSMKLIGK